MYLYASRFLSFNVQKNFHSFFEILFDFRSIQSILLLLCHYSENNSSFSIEFHTKLIWFIFSSASLYLHIVFIFYFLFLPFTIIFVIQLYSSVAIVWKYVCFAFHKAGRDLTHNVQLMWSLYFFSFLDSFSLF